MVPVRVASAILLVGVVLVVVGLLVGSPTDVPDSQKYVLQGYGNTTVRVTVKPVSIPSARDGNLWIGGGFAFVLVGGLSATAHWTRRRRPSRAGSA